MAVDASKIEEVAKQQRQALEERFKDEEGWVVGDVCIVAEMHNTERNSSSVALRNSGMRAHHVRGLLDEAQDLARREGAGDSD